MAESTPFRIEVHESKAGSVIELHGELDMFTVQEAEAMVMALAARKRSVVIDLRQLEFMDSKGVGMLVRADALARQDGFNLFVTKGTDATQRLLKMCGLLEHFAQIDAPEDINV